MQLCIFLLIKESIIQFSVGKPLGHKALALNYFYYYLFTKTVDLTNFSILQ